MEAASTVIGTVFSVVTSSLFPWNFEHEALKDFIATAKTPTQEPTPLWRDDHLAESNTVNVTAALVAAVVSAAFSWPTTAESPWTTKAAFYASLVLALSAIASASQQSTALYRYGKHPTGLEKLRKDLARPMEGAISSKLQTYTLRVPVMLLNISVILLLIGLIILIWNIAARAPAWDSDMKIAFVVRLAGVFALANHVIGTVAMSKWHHESNRYQSE